MASSLRFALRMRPTVMGQSIFGESRLLSASVPKENILKTFNADAIRQNYFLLFKLTPTFSIDLNQLKKQFTDLQRALHPDKFATATMEDQDKSAELSSLVNMAYKTLQDSHDRGLYLLQMKGISISEEDDGQSLGGDFLQEVMTMNELVEEVKDQAELEKLRSQVQEQMSTLEATIEASFKDDNLDDCKKLLMRLKFYRTIWSAIKVKREIE